MLEGLGTAAGRAFLPSPSCSISPLDSKASTGGRAQHWGVECRGRKGVGDCIASERPNLQADG
jgi:hypothetical protein